MLSHTSTAWAPWYVIPADHKWFARIAAAAIWRTRSSGSTPTSRPSDDEARSALLASKVELEAEATAAATAAPVAAGRE